MIKSIRLTNFYSFKDTTIEFDKNINVLIGINGSGKSNLFKAFDLLFEGVAGNGLQKLVIEKWGGIDEILFKGGKENVVKLKFVFDGKLLKKYGFGYENDVIYEIELCRVSGLNNFQVNESIYDGKFTFNVYGGNPNIFDFNKNSGINTHRPVSFENHTFNPRELALSKVFFIKDYGLLESLRRAIADIVVYRFFNTNQDSQIRKAMKATAGKRLLPDGSNLPQILNTIKISHKREYQNIVERLNDVNENFRGFDFHFLGSGNFELMLDESGLDSAIHVTNISDGTLRYLCLLSILYNPERGRFICIDEPEVGLHPDMSLNITKAIKESSMESTMLITTHSENILDAFEVEHVRVFEKKPDNSSIVNSFETKDFEKWYDEYNLGKMWRQGDIGGNRW
ncbi:MAG: AAA family ATPase [Chlorobi bacterium]|nr:AAA family ATPase [Chlorobiota bacterium]